MKSFTRSHPNPQSIRADRRLDALVKNQNMEHEHLLACHNKEMQQLRESLKLAIERFDSLSQKNDMDLKTFGKESNESISFLKEIIVDHEKTILEQKKSIEYLQDQLLNFHVLHASARDLDGAKKESEQQIREATNNHLCSLQDIQREFKSLIASFREDFNKFKEEADKRLCEQSDRIESRFNVNKIDKEGVLKEIRVQEKKLFVIEKNIENIYTQIERVRAGK